MVIKDSTIKTTKKEVVARNERDNKKKWMLILGSGIVAILLNTIFSREYYQAGLSVFLFEILFLGLVFFAFPQGKKDVVACIGLTLCISQSLRYAIFNTPVIGIINFFVLIFLNIALITYYTGITKNLRDSFLSIKEYIEFPFVVIGKYVSKGLKMFPHIQKRSKYDNKKVFANIGNITLSFGILLGLFAIIIPLLSDADSEFKVLISHSFSYIQTSLVHFISHFHISSSILTFLKIAFFSYGIWIILITLNYISSPEKPKRNTTTVNTLRSNIVLIGVNSIYILFCILQAKYLFFGNHQALVDRGFASYSEYVHKGFNELIIVAIINFVLFYIFFPWNKKKCTCSPRVISLFVLILSTLGIIFSAHARISIYVGAYGQTISRIFVFYAIFLIGAVFLILLYKLYKPQKQFFPRLLGIVLVSFSILSYRNIDKYIIQHNINHNIMAKEMQRNMIKGNSDTTKLAFKVSRTLDWSYLLQLSHDAATEQFMMLKKFPKESEKLKYRYLKLGVDKLPWYRFNYYSYKLKKLLEN